ncbi:hypothetical protein [Leptospira noguchii]|uniref:hypothetical protein n=1 Tax=Leptospira noguchii TaxID=28182 RepID=UPI001F46EA83|nr:hypothetical protein [Leptospira noguchii]
MLPKEWNNLDDIEPEEKLALMYADSFLSDRLDRFKKKLDIQLEIDSVKSNSYKSFLEKWQIESWPEGRARSLGEAIKKERIADLEKLKERV